MNEDKIIQMIPVAHPLWICCNSGEHAAVIGVALTVGEYGEQFKFLATSKDGIICLVGYDEIQRVYTAGRQDDERQNKPAKG